MNSDKVRFDRWLWAARLYKTRSLATRAVSGGKARLNGRRAKAGAWVRVGDEIRVTRGPIEMTVVVRELSIRRGPAKVATTLYRETEQSRELREERAIQLKQMPVVVHRGKGRPTKKERREIDRLKNRPFE